MSIALTLSQDVPQGAEINSFPRHVAIIMDGNRRWAQERGFPQLEGHRRGSQNLESITRFAADVGLEFLTVYAFSSENWRRSEGEVNGLINLMRYYLQTKVVEFHENGVRLNIIGDYHAFPRDVVSMIQESLELTKNNRRITLNVALNYGARAEILKATRQISSAVAEGQMNINDITEERFEEFLWTAGIPDPEIFIRTSGEKRISNYLLWQLSYTELFFVEKYWPDFTEKDLMNAIEEYQGRHRRFGAL